MNFLRTYLEIQEKDCSCMHYFVFSPSCHWLFTHLCWSGLCQKSSLFWYPLELSTLGNNRALLQGDAASCAMQEATNLDGTAFFGPLCLTSAFANERRSSHKNHMCNCLCTCNAWTDTLAKEGLWLANPSAAAGLPVPPYFWRLPLWIRGVRRVSSS